MTAFNMIMEGWTAWMDRIPQMGPVLPAFLFLAGITIAALGHFFTRLQQPKQVEEPEKPVQHIDFVNVLPFPLYIKDNSGQEIANTAMPLPATTEPPDETLQRLNFNGHESWFKLGDSTKDGIQARFALPADDLVDARDKFKRLMETLTTTFAHLPVGLAVFDADRTLTLFNPALSEMLGLSPTWLAMHPALASFLEKLRDNRHLPERRNFLEWRRLLTEMEAAADNKDYTGEWSLANGKILRVQGQAHNRGAIAFLFEDITAEVEVARLRNSETALNQTILDHIGDAIAVLDPAGRSGFTNAHFDRVFSVNPAVPNQGFGIDDLKALIPTSKNTRQFFARLSDFVAGNENRFEWSHNLPEPVNRTLRVIPLPEGYTLISLSPIRHAKNSGISALGRLAETMFTILNESNSMSDPLNLTGLENFLEKRNISLNMDAFSKEGALRSAPVKTRRILWYLVLAASNVCRDGGQISLTTNENPRSTRFSCLVEDKDILAGQNNHLSLSLLRQLVDQAGGGADWVFDERARPLTVSCVLPVEEMGQLPDNMANIG